MHVLVVDDCERLRTIVATVLEAVGCRVETAADGSSGLDRFMADTPDAIITDINMPVMDGLTFVSRVRDQPQGLGLPIFVLSSDDCPRKRERAKAYGVRQWVDKPTNLAALAAAVLHASG